MLRFRFSLTAYRLNIETVTSERAANQNVSDCAIWLAPIENRGDECLLVIPVEPLW